MAKECDSKTCDKSSCEGCASKKNPQSMQAEMNPMSDVKHVIGIVSGKGGVGKSFVTASLANRMAKKGYKVGILDADITGPSIPKMYGLKGAAQVNDSGIFPMETKNGIDSWKHGKTVLDRCYLGRCRLPLCRYAARNRRCSADCIPVPSD